MEPDSAGTCFPDFGYIDLEFEILIVEVFGASGQSAGRHTQNIRCIHSRKFDTVCRAGRVEKQQTVNRNMPVYGVQGSTLESNSIQKNE